MNKVRDFKMDNTSGNVKLHDAHAANQDYDSSTDIFNKKCQRLQMPNDEAINQFRNMTRKATRKARDIYNRLNNK